MSKHSVDYEAFRGVAIDVFKTRNLMAVQSLKKFLTALPSPSHIKAVLLQAFYHLAEEDLEVGRWVLQHRHDLEPELNLLEVAQQMVINRLQLHGRRLNQDFSFAPSGQLEMSKTIQLLLMEDLSQGDRLLLEEVLQLRVVPNPSSS